jgi:two-component system, response regulator PdtaR
MQSKVLLVDDDKLILSTISKGLRLAGYLVTAAGSGHEALDCVVTDPPDIAILDIRMPDLNGIELAQHLISLNKELPIIFLSAYSDDEILKEAFDSGCITYLVKPCSVQQIALTVESVLKQVQEITELKEQNYHLDNALSQSRDIAIAIGLIMQEYQLEKDVAFSKLRNAARTDRKKVVTLAGELIRQVQNKEPIKL